MKEIIKKYIATQVRSNCFENIPLTTKRIKEGYEKGVVTNSKIFDELITLENLGIISIKQAARSNKLFSNRKNWIKRKQSICRYIIDILTSEYFDVMSVSDTNWAIKASVDTQNRNLVLQFNGIEEPVLIRFKRTKDHRKSKIMDFFERAQNEPNEYCECLMAKSHTSVHEFFKRFCLELYPFFVEFEKQGYRAKFFPVVYPEMLKLKKVAKVTFTDKDGCKDTFYCKFDENGRFLGWRRN